MVVVMKLMCSYIEAWIFSIFNSTITYFFPLYEAAIKDEKNH